MTSPVRRGPWPGDPRVATLTLDSPANRNALSRALVEDLLAGLAQAAADETVAAVLLRAAGPAFCSGADLSEALAGGTHEANTRLVALLRVVVCLPKPVVAVVEGPVRAGGTGLLAACDVVLCAGSVTFAFTESRLSLAPAVISLTVLPRLTPRAAAWAFLSGAEFDAAEAERIGLVTTAVPATELDDAVAGTFRELLRATPQGLTETKRLLNAPLLQRIDADGARLARSSAELFDSPAARAAMSEFLHRPDRAHDH